MKGYIRLFAYESLGKVRPGFCVGDKVYVLSRTRGGSKSIRIDPSNLKTIKEASASYIIEVRTYVRKNDVMGQLIVTEDLAERLGIELTYLITT